MDREIHKKIHICSKCEAKSFLFIPASFISKAQTENLKPCCVLYSCYQSGWAEVAGQPAAVFRFIVEIWNVMETDSYKKIIFQVHNYHFLIWNKTEYGHTLKNFATPANPLTWWEDSALEGKEVNIGYETESYWNYSSG